MSVPVGPQWRIAQAEKIRAAMGPEMKPEEGVPTQWHGERKRA